MREPFQEPDENLGIEQLKKVKEHKPKPMRHVIRDAWLKVYPADGLDIQAHEYNGVKINKKSEGKFSPAHLKARNGMSNYYDHQAVNNISSFFGLPNYDRHEGGYKKFSTWANIFRNLIGWQISGENSDDLEKKIRLALNILKLIIPITLVWNVATAVLTTAVNVVKIFTEFLPRMFTDVFNEARGRAYQKYKSDKGGGYLALAILFGAGQVLSETVFFVGQAITSPAKNIRYALSLSERLAKAFGADPTSKKVGALKLGLILLSIALTATAYAFFFPLAIKFIGATIIPKLPLAISHAWNALGHFIGPVATKVGSALGKFMAPMFQKAFTASGLVIEPAGVGAAALLGTASSVAGPPVQKMKYKLSVRWNEFDLATSISNAVHKYKAYQKKKSMSSNTSTVPAPSVEEGQKDSEPTNNTTMQKALSENANPKKSKRETNLPPGQHKHPVYGAPTVQTRKTLPLPQVDKLVSSNEYN
ncbi:Uncharacterised protein [Legionella busanensis]|uniref:Uncharacterized protein n=1 Tax=Legionella busanensis TaxID=190655 RepID=A0A378JVI6_9GAMM|nr:hypothetical protein [Legionella busanensis]STX52222.1 Uncharacterised protein [Legionella busanensis]